MTKKRTWSSGFSNINKIIIKKIMKILIIKLKYINKYYKIRNSDRIWNQKRDNWEISKMIKDKNATV